MRETEQKFAEQKLKEARETYDRLRTVSHVQTEPFSGHQRIEGYQEYPAAEHFFGKDRLWKRENMFGVVQVGYDPQREKLFLFAHIKTSRYDTAAGRCQKEMSAPGQKALLKRQGESRAYVSGRREMAAVLIERRKNRPWTGGFLKAYTERREMEAAGKLLPFFSREEEREELERLRAAARARQETVRSLQVLPPQSQETAEQEQERRMRREQLLRLRKEGVRDLILEHLLQAVQAVKDGESRRFLTGANYAYRYQRTEIEAYYRGRKRARDQALARADAAEDAAEDEK